MREAERGYYTLLVVEFRPSQKVSRYRVPAHCDRFLSPRRQYFVTFGSDSQLSVSSHHDVPGDLNPVSQYSRKLLLRCFGDGLLDDRICDPVTTKTVRHDCNRIAFDPGKVFAKRLSDVETDKRLITAEPKCSRDLFKVLQDIFRHTDAD